jgi:hypothetical protein
MSHVLLPVPLVGLLLLGACARGTPPADRAAGPALAQVGDERLDGRALGWQGPGAPPLAELERLTDTAAAAAEARRLGLERDPEVRREVGAVLARAAERAERERFFKATPVTDAAIGAHYEANRATFTIPARWIASQVLLAERAAADRVVTAARGTTDEPAFLAAARSLGKGAVRPAPPQVVITDARAGREQAPVAAAVRVLREPGAVAGPVETPAGFYVLRLQAHEPGRVRALADERDRIRAALEHEAWQGRRQAWLAELRQRWVKLLVDAGTPPPAALPADPGRVAPGLPAPNAPERGGRVASPLRPVVPPPLPRRAPETQPARATPP